MRIAVINNSPDKVAQVYSRDLLARLGVLSHIYTKKDVEAEPTLFADTEYIFSTWGMPCFDDEQIARYFPELRCIFYAAGSVQTFARPFLNRGVRVFSAWAANAVPVAEYTVSQILLANKGFFAYSNTVCSRDRGQAAEMKKVYRGNYGERVGLIGFGMIGSLVAQMLQAYMLQVLVYDPFLSEERACEYKVRRASLYQIFSECSVISNHTADKPETRGMLGHEQFSLMRQGAVFINTGRGAQVREDELVQVLRDRPDIIALLDVTYPEPPVAEHPFHDLKNCILTPHIAGSLGDEVHRMSEYMEQEYMRYISGEKCLYEVKYEMLDRMA